MRKNQEDSIFKRSWFQDSREDEFKIQEKKSRRLHKGSIENIFQKPNIAQFFFSKEFFSKFSKLPEFLLSGNDYQFPVIDYQWQSLISKAFNWICNVPIDF